MKLVYIIALLVSVVVVVEHAFARRSHVGTGKRKSGRGQGRLTNTNGEIVYSTKKVKKGKLGTVEEDPIPERNALYEAQRTSKKKKEAYKSDTSNLAQPKNRPHDEAQDLYEESMQSRRSPARSQYSKVARNSHSNDNITLQSHRHQSNTNKLAPYSK
eukprot:Platyproteum_vivax@DN15037_c0_g1_i1.p1